MRGALKCGTNLERLKEKIEHEYSHSMSVEELQDQPSWVSVRSSAGSARAPNFIGMGNFNYPKQKKYEKNTHGFWIP